MAVYPAISAAVWNWRATSPRRVKPFILAAIHITGNWQLPSALQEANYSNRIGSGASFHFVVNRNGSVVQCADPVTRVAWTNGSWRNPNWNLSTVVKAVTQGYGANDATFMTIENVGYEPGHSLTAAQVEADAKLIAWGRKVSGIGVGRVTILGHRDYDSVGRYYCPTSGNLSYLLGRITTRATQILTPATSTGGKINMLLRPVQEQWYTRTGSSGYFYTHGPGSGTRKNFYAKSRVTSIAESADGKWRVLAYGREILWMPRANLIPIPGTRRPSSGYGLA